ncbi:hypothetical protein TVNIR_2512 [Thioalkalivibrio nitratireducens DSM 14787]|uniref:Uncharacterized protein n=1 Tax=Thioalkalivibrio nitratireducens (strain DSM 14787 / UNIQEM 213 / ALEN2) TaxID=1255043 RepID=L0DYW4_THIND|nr:hypothetical protein TVNIR_2512 [Thioalkalivibrio nitratireducens DSM 14787]
MQRNSGWMESTRQGSADIPHDQSAPCAEASQGYCPFVYRT